MRKSYEYIESLLVLEGVAVPGDGPKGPRKTKKNEERSWARSKKEGEEEDVVLLEHSYKCCSSFPFFYNSLGPLTHYTEKMKKQKDTLF